MKINNKKSFYKKLFIIGVSIYVLFVFINQQKTLNSYRNTSKHYQAQIEEKTEYQKELYEIKANINSKEYIEKIARENLDMYLPNERVYVAKGR